MARRQKHRRTKAKISQDSEASPFWRIVSATLLIILALFLLMGSFHAGGTLPSDLFGGGYWLLGWTAYLLPVAFTYWAIHKLKNEEHRIPIANLLSMIGVLIFLASLLFSLFAVHQAGQYSGGHGGMAGQLLGKGALMVLDKLSASLMFGILVLLALALSFSITPSVIARVWRLLSGPGDTGDNDLERLRSSDSNGFRLNEGVPVEHGHGRSLSSLKNTAEKLSSSENHEALTVASDPDWKFPPLNLLDQRQDKADAGDVNANAQTIRDTFANFNIDVDMEGANVGPRVTQYTLKPPTGVKLTKITALDNNLALDLAAQSIRIEAPIPGKRAVGIEVPNVKPAMVRLSAILQSSEWAELQSPLSFAIGKDIAGKSVVATLDRMPHLLVAGQTGSGKSVMINTILTSMLYRNSPADLKLILVDPKQVELKPYDDIPHLLTPVITEPEKCISALKWAVAEMERRYKALAEVGKRNIAEYNLLKQEAGMPYIVIVVDELADLMMMAARDVEALVVRIAQKARAVGIHLVVATQRPSVDVITGLIKANIPARIAFTTASQVDSRTIIDQVGAEKLLGQGDMLLLTADMPKPRRIQGSFISDNETAKVTDFIRMQRPPQYDAEVISQPVQIGKGGVVTDYGANEADDDMWRDAVHVVIESRKASTSLLQRRLRIGYGRAARLIETMEEQGIVGPADGARPREVLVNNLDEVFGGGDSPGPAEAVEEPGA
ncbi:MAG TPA: DNA translocase FtsK 4TM domain-containing protein [Candidatus Saccharimonadales bacterium]|nr:DNA translocase FtsK 4TM domain-containing protein [Candidatus Saccharimonadales bacterium]